MSFQPIKSICQNIFSGNIKKIENEVNQIISYCKMLRKEIKSSKTINYTKHMITEHMYIIYYCFKCIGIVKLTSDLNIDKFDQEIESYLNNFFSENETYLLFNQLLKSAKEEKNKDEQYFYENMINKCYKNKDCIEIEKKIKNLQNKIQTELKRGEIIKIPSFLKKYFGDRETILMDRKMYYLLLKKINDPEIRKNIEKLYFMKSYDCLENLENLILLRTEYANKNKCETYFEYVKKKEKFNSENSEEILGLMDNLIKNFKNRSIKETQRILRKLKNDNYDKKVEFHDFIYFYEEMCSKCTFSLEDSLKILLKAINKYFHIEFIKFKYGDKLWNEKINSYQIYNCEKELLGYIHFDMNFDENKKISSPLCIHMCHNYHDINSGVKYNTNVALLANYHNNEITHADFITLAKELGNALQFLCYKTTTGNMIYRDNFYLLTSKIMEYIAWEENILLKLCNRDKKLSEHLLFTRFIDFGNSINLRCVNAYFDYILHNSSSLIKDLKQYIKNNGKLDGQVFKNLYQGIYKNIFSPQKDIFEININIMHPVVILNEINGTEASVYENIIIEILSFSVFNLIKGNEGKKYIKILSKAGSTEFKESLNKFINKLGDNYTLYLHELIDYDEIDTELNMKIKNDNSINSSTNDSANYFFDDKTEDQENEFYIDRKLEL